MYPGVRSIDKRRILKVLGQLSLKEMTIIGWGLTAFLGLGEKLPDFTTPVH